MIQHLEPATVSATNRQPRDLKALAMQVIRRNQCNSNGNQTTTQTTSSSCQVSTPMQCNKATSELTKLIYLVSKKYGGDSEQFLTEYIKYILDTYGINDALVCFRDLEAQTPPANNRK